MAAALQSGLGRLACGCITAALITTTVAAVAVFFARYSDHRRQRVGVSANRLAEGVDPATVYARLRAANPAPFAGLAVFADRAVASSSPERLVSIAGRVVQTRPIAGTYPRNPDRDADRALSEAMLTHPKERAEHIMLIDLERNDLGRVCRTGSIEVNELMVLESYTHVHHIVSNIRGTLRADVTPAQVIRAVFPGGTITGCPIRER